MQFRITLVLLFSFLFLTTGCNSGLPNIILISIDSLRADHLSSYGYSRETSPILDSLASSGVLYELCQSQAPWTLPSHASMFTGLSVIAHGTKHDGAYDRMLDPALPSLPVYLQTFGYKTASFVNVKFLTEPFGFDVGFDHFWYNPDYTINGELTINTAIDWLQQEIALEADSTPLPLFMFIHLWDVHAPYDAPSPYCNYYTNQSMESGSRWLVGDDGVVINVGALGVFLARYDGCISFADYQLGRLFAELRTLEIDDNTLIIVTSDHGEEFLEHGGVYHGATLYQELLHVPLIIAGPGVPRGVRESKPCGVFDIFPTIAGLIEMPLPETILGVDLFSDLYVAERVIPSSGINSPSDSLNTLVAVLKGSFKLIWGFQTETGSQFDLQTDPGEQNAIPVLSTLRQEADYYLLTPPQAIPQRVDDDSVNEQLRDLGYIR